MCERGNIESEYAIYGAEFRDGADQIGPQKREQNKNFRRESEEEDDMALWS